MMELIQTSLLETLGMVTVASLISLAFGLPLAIWLNLTGKDGLMQNAFLYNLSGFLVNAVRSIPYIILAVLIMPMTRLLVGSSIGMWAAVVPLSLAGILLVARVGEDALRQVPRGVIEVGLAVGATRGQIVRSVLLPEALPAIVAGFTTIVINIIGFSAMAGTVGGGGLGDLAIRYGYQRYDVTLMFIIVFILIVLVQLVQWLGDRIVAGLRK